MSVSSVELAGLVGLVEAVLVLLVDAAVVLSPVEALDVDPAAEVAPDSMSETNANRSLTRVDARLVGVDPVADVVLPDAVLADVVLAVASELAAFVDAVVAAVELVLDEPLCSSAIKD